MVLMKLCMCLLCLILYFNLIVGVIQYQGQIQFSEPTPVMQHQNHIQYLHYDEDEDYEWEEFVGEIENHRLREQEQKQREREYLKFKASAKERERQIEELSLQIRVKKEREAKKQLAKEKVLATELLQWKAGSLNTATSGKEESGAVSMSSARYYPNTVLSIRQTAGNIQSVCRNENVRRYMYNYSPKFDEGYDENLNFPLCELAKLSTNNQTYKSIVNKMRYHPGFIISNIVIKSVNNPYINVLYELKKLELRSKFGTELMERNMFHATQTKKVDSILLTNFNQIMRYTAWYYVWTRHVIFSKVFLFYSFL